MKQSSTRSLFCGVSLIAGAQIFCMEYSLAFEKPRLSNFKLQRMSKVVLISMVCGR